MTGRRSVVAQRQAIAILEDLDLRGAFVAGGTFNRPVILGYLSAYREKIRTELEDFEGMKISNGALDEEIRARAKHRPQRWNDTTPRFKNKMIYFDVKWEPECFRDFSLWIGHSLVHQSVRDRKPLAALVLKRLDAGVKKAFPNDRVGFWFNLERKPNRPLALHVHGIVRTDNPDLFNDRAKLKVLREAIRLAAGERHSHSPARLLHMQRREVDLGWWKYISKQSRSRFGKVVRNESPSLYFGKKIDATSHFVTETTRGTYARLRPIVDGIQTGEIADWTAAEWVRTEALGRT